MGRKWRNQYTTLWAALLQPTAMPTALPLVGRFAGDFLCTRIIYLSPQLSRYGLKRYWVTSYAECSSGPYFSLKGGSHSFWTFEWAEDRQILKREPGQKAYVGGTHAVGFSKASRCNRLSQQVVEGPTVSKQRLLMTVMHSVLLYGYELQQATHWKTLLEPNVSTGRRSKPQRDPKSYHAGLAGPLAWSPHWHMDRWSARVNREKPRGG